MKGTITIQEAFATEDNKDLQFKIVTQFEVSS